MKPARLLLTKLALTPRRGNDVFTADGVACAIGGSCVPVIHSGGNLNARFRALEGEGRDKAGHVADWDDVIVRRERHRDLLGSELGIFLGLSGVVNRPSRTSNLRQQTLQERT